MFHGKNALIHVSYLLGTALIISALVYFFAANWGALERLEKIALATLFFLLFYALSFFFERFFPFRPLLAKLTFFAGTVAFGVSVAVVGQVYNSHADSYLLFLIWFIPALLFSLITRYQHDYILSYILFHLAYILYIAPRGVLYTLPEGMALALLVVLSLLNLGLFFVLKKKIVHSPFLERLSFVVFFGIWLVLTAQGAFPTYAFLLHVTFHVIVIIVLILALKNKWPRFYWLTWTIAYTFYLFEKLFQWMLFNESEWVFLFIIAFSIGLIAICVYFIRWLSRKINVRRNGRWFVDVIALFSALLFSYAFFSFVHLFFNNVSPLFFYSVAIAFILIVVSFTKRLDDVVTHALTYAALFFFLSVTWELSPLYVLIVIALLVIVSIRMKRPVVRTIIYFFGNLYIIIASFHYSFSSETNVIIYLFVQLLIFSLLQAIPNRDETLLLKRNALFYSLCYAFILTFLFHDVPVVYYLMNAAYFIITTALCYYVVKREKTTELKIVAFFWGVYLIYKYYDVVWSLLHQSLALFIAGLIFLAVAFYFERKDEREKSAASIKWRKKVPLLIVIALQVVFIGYQYVTNEQLLREGALIKLELEPLDPRSILQGDYVRLHYTISNLPEFGEQLPIREKVLLLLSPNEEGVYEYAGYYVRDGKWNRPYEMKEDDVLIRATYYGNGHFVYGIETYFVEEGTGRDLERFASVAYVRVSKNGNAIVENVE